MMTSLACLFDRIITARLELWLPISEEQSAYQKSKSTINHIFTLRLIIELAKKCTVTLYIGFFDIKGFDRVSRYILFKKLVKIGISQCMLKALQLCYTMTECIVSSGGEYSEKFLTSSGIRQGASSSARLFIFFMDGLIQFLKSQCAPEVILEDLHSLLHADDTVLVSTQEALFVKKCNTMISYFDENKLSLNIGKSGYMIINGKDTAKTGLRLRTGILEYVNSYVYLGYTLTDTGSVQKDIDQHVTSKRGNSTVKFMNFCRTNCTAPLFVKLNVLEACVNSCYLYGCEAWGDANYSKLDILQRRALRTALSVRQSVNNEIVHTESGQYPLFSTIKPRQLKFWIKMKTFMENNEESYITKLVTKARQLDLSYINYYDHLVTHYTSPENCVKVLRKDIQESLKHKFQNSFEADAENKLGAYLLVNPELNCPEIGNIPEFERIKITRYRCGAHYLEIEKGRFQRKNREDRLCMCGDVQTLSHVILDCPLVTRIPQATSLKEFFKLDTRIISDFLTSCEKRLKIQRS